MILSLRNISQVDNFNLIYCFPSQFVSVNSNKISMSPKIRISLLTFLFFLASLMTCSFNIAAFHVEKMMSNENETAHDDLNSFNLSTAEEERSYDVCEIAMNVAVCESQNRECKVNRDIYGGFECICKKGAKADDSENCIYVCDIHENIDVCKKKKGKCKANEEEEKGFECICKKGDKVDEAGNCIDVCDINENIDVCKKKNGNCKVKEEEENGFECICRKGDKVDEAGNCIDICDILENVEVCKNTNGKCKANVDKEEGFECICQKGHEKDDSENCIECDCGEYSKLCTFVEGEKSCECEDGYAVNNGKCEECQCGENSEKCYFKKGVKTCRCKPGYAPKNGICEECNCGKNATACYFEGDNKKCRCNKGFSDNGGTCEACDCGINSTKCELKDGKLECTCKVGNAQKGTKCEALCDKDMDCKNGAQCKENNDNKFCKCLKGTTGNKCESITACLSDGMYARCEGNKGTCVYDPRSQKAICNCTANMQFDIKAGHCQDMCTKDDECKNGKACYNKWYCVCEDGKTGDNCDIITGCTDELKKKCEAADAECVFAKEEQTKATCGCNNKNFTYDKGQNQCIGCKCSNGKCVTDNRGKVKCVCKPGHSHQDEFACKPCDCGYKGKCIFTLQPKARGDFTYEKKCICDLGSAEKDGKCIDCYCGENSSCEFNGEEKICYCIEGYSVKSGVCTRDIAGKKTKTDHTAFYAAIILGASLTVVLIILFIVVCKMHEMRKNLI